jgi:uncharacterized alkaline shock family protein YloU
MTTTLQREDTDTGVAERGRTTLTDSVVQRVATALVGDIDGVGGTAQRLLNVAVGGPGFERSAQVNAHVDGNIATLTVRCSVAYPAPVASTTEILRTYLVARLGVLTGLDVRRVDITVTALHTDVGRRVR